ncbi:hypothetical protein EVAR_98660_1 [Eumeta japonica]|uniref:Uncharacterized protein n=1 Tax=Eumeta variegata TaxID=151549 RepID=A0A4C1XUF2_EUMVA|nr:hypothetical protein EVAR_98660_1 [Eumeta japonica]
MVIHQLLSSPQTEDEIMSFVFVCNLRAHLRITAGGDGVLYAVHGVTSQISAVVNSVPIHLYGVTGAVCLLEVGPETTTAPATCSITSRGLRRGASCRRHGESSRHGMSPGTVTGRFPFSHRPGAVCGGRVE